MHQALIEYDSVPGRKSYLEDFWIDAYLLQRRWALCLCSVLSRSHHLLAFVCADFSSIAINTNPFFVLEVSDPMESVNALTAATRAHALLFLQHAFVQWILRPVGTLSSPSTLLPQHPTSFRCSYKHRHFRTTPHRNGRRRLRAQLPSCGRRSSSARAFANATWYLFTYGSLLACDEIAHDDITHGAARSRICSGLLRFAWRSILSSSALCESRVWAKIG